jgi:tight adherence protein C
MTDTTIAMIVGGTVGLCALFLLFSLSRLKAEVPTEDREYMDPLPFALKIVWPLVRFPSTTCAPSSRRTCWNARTRSCS